MAKALLRDDSLLYGEDPADRPFTARALLDCELPATDEWVAENAVDNDPTVSIRTRTRTGFSDDGDPVYDWLEVLSDATAVLWETREEQNEATGVVTVLGRLVVLYDGTDPVDERSIVTDSLGSTWRVTAVTNNVPGNLRLDLARVTGGDG